MKIIRIASISAGMLFYSQAVFAVDEAAKPTAPPAKVLSELNVTAVPYEEATGYVAPAVTSALKSEKPLLETPQAVQIVPREVIDDRKPLTINEAVKNVSGVQTAPGGYYDNLYIRGFSTVVDTYRNGLRLNSMRGVPDMAFVDHVEVAKGPSSMLYGRVQPGGLVNTVTKKPQAKAAYSIQQQVASNDQYRTTIDATGPVTTDKSLLYRLIGVYDQGDSFVDNQQHRNWAGAAYASWIPTSRFELNVQLEHYDKKMTNVAYAAQQIPVPTGSNRPLNLPRNWTQNDPVMWSNFPSTEKSTLYSYDWTFGITDKWKLTNRLVFGKVDDVMSMMTSVAYTPATGSLTRRVTYNPLVRDVLNTNLDLSGEFATGFIKHSLLAGFDYVYHRTKYSGYRQQGGATPGVPALNVFSPIYGNIDPAALHTLMDPAASNIVYYQNMNDMGLYAQDQMSIGKHLELLLGVRYDKTFDPVTKMVGITSAACYPNCDGTLDPNTPTERATSPRVGLLYKINDQASVYGSYSESFGNSNGSALVFDGSRPPPQKGEQYEVGVKGSLLDNKVTTSLTYFDLYQKNRMTPDPDHTGYSLPAGEVRSQGVEFDIAGQVSRHVSLIGSYTYNYARITKDNTKGATSIVGKRLYGVPLNSGAVWAKYDTAPSSPEGWGFGAGAFLNGERQGNNTNTFQLPGYARFDAMLSYRTKFDRFQLSAQLNVQNLLDATYFESTDGASNAYYAAPRTYTGTLALNF